ncbi:unnamed protein product [Rhodiola kirilowii]
MMLSKNASEELIDHIRRTLGVKVVQNHAKYLGLPTVVSRCYTQTMQGIIDKMRNKTGSWKSVTLSQGGEVLRQPKEEQGLGFYNFKFWNMAFLAKQCWRLTQDPESLAGKVFKAKYFSNCHLLEAPLTSKPSHVWRALHEAIPVLRFGCCVNAGNSEVDMEDEFFWLLDIKSAYKLLQVMHDSNNLLRGEQSDKSRLVKMWKSIWRLPIPRKIRIFLWRLYHAAISTGQQMMKRHLACGYACPGVPMQI